MFLPLHKLPPQERYPHPNEKSWHERIHPLTCYIRNQCSLKLVTMMVKLGNVCLGGQPSDLERWGEDIHLLPILKLDFIAEEG